MSDKELLELAARAAGIAIDPIDAMHEPDDWIAWNPLTDDGDALRLAVTLKLDLEFKSGAMVCIQETSGIGFAYSYNNDPYAATRRAIVRAAAAIGKDIK